MRPAARSTHCSSTRRGAAQAKYREALLAHAEDARQSRELLRIRTDVHVPFDLEQLSRTAVPIARALLRRCSHAAVPFARDGVRADGRCRRHATTTPSSTDAELAALGRRDPRARPVGTPRAARRTDRDSRGHRRARVLDSTRRGVVHPALSRAPCSVNAGPRRAARCSMPCGRCSKTDRLPKIGHDLKVRRDWCSHVRASTLDGPRLRHDARQLSAGSRRDRPHDLEDSALEHLGYKALSEEDVCGKGVKAATLGAAARAPRC